jgi:hypothetical protein
VALTIERSFLVWFPRETKARYTKKVAVISLGIVGRSSITIDKIFPNVPTTIRITGHIFNKEVAM